MSDKMLIDASHSEETRVVVVRGNRIEEFDFESQHKKQLRGNIYLAKVTRVEPSLQAAFVDYGGNRHGFLAFSEIHPDYYQIPLADRQALLAAEAEAEAERARAENEEDDAADASDSGGAAEPDEGGVTEIIDEDDDGDAKPQKAKGRSRARRGRKSDNRSRKTDDDSDNGVDEIAAIVEADEISEPVEGRNDNVEDRDPGEIDHDAALHVEGKGDMPEALPSAEARPEPAEEPIVAVEAPADDEPDNEGIAAEATEAEPDSDAEAAPAKAKRGNADNGEEAVAKVDSVGAEDALEELPDRSTPRKPRKQYRIQEVIKRRQIMLVQVVKEERGNKGAALTTYLSLAGRYSVLMPNTARGGGISRKITNVADRKRLKEVARGLDVPQGMGVILRTAGANRTKAEVKRDFEYLMRLWENVRNLTLASTAPCLVYEEGSLIKRSIRDLYNRDISEIIVSGEEGYREAKGFMRMLMPSHAKVVQPYRDIHPIFSRSGIEAQLDRMLQPQVTLKSGGYIIINQTEALVAIDVNSGRSTKEHSIEDTALQTNLEAADEVARQLRLRDLAGLIVVDFIDMEEKRNNRSVEKRLKDALKNDRARIQVGRISHFGLLEMSRQRIRASVLESTTQVCEHCGGTGHVRSQSSVALHVLRSIEEFLLKSTTHNITVRTTPQTALYLLNQKRETIIEMERRFGVSITIEGDTTIGAAHLAIDRGTAVETPVRIENIAAEIVYPEDDDDDVPVSFDDDEDEEATAEAADAGEKPAQRNQRQSDDSEGGSRGKRRRRRRGRRDRDGEPTGPRTLEAGDDGSAASEDEDGDEDEGDSVAAGGASETGDGERPKKRRRRGKRGGRRNRNGDEDQQAASSEADEGSASGEDQTEADRPVVEPEMTGGEADVVETAVDDETVVNEAVASLSDETVSSEAPALAETGEEPVEEKPKKRRAPRRKKADAAAEAAPDAVAEEPNAAPSADNPEPAQPVEAAATPAVEDEAQPAEATAETASEVQPPVTQAPASPVVSSNGGEATDKPKKGGWWQRRGFF